MPVTFQSEFMRTPRILTMCVVHEASRLMIFNISVSSDQARLYEPYIGHSLQRHAY